MVFELIWLAICLPIFALALTLINLFVWPRGRTVEHVEPTSILVPARNEEANIERCVRAAFAADGTHEMIVYEDRSEDRTAEILERLTTEFDSLKIVNGVPLPDGWVGKPHACFQLAKHASCDRWVYVDADVTLQPDGIVRLQSVANDYLADVVSGVPRQNLTSWFERWILPLLHLTYLAWLPLPLIWRTDDPRFLAANGQLLYVNKNAYEEIGGFESVHNAVVDDMAFCANAKKHKKRVVFMDGYRVASCQMYGSASEVWRGFSKNIFEGIGSVVGLVFVITLYLATFVLPYGLLIAGIWVPSLSIIGAIGVGANLVMRVLLAFRFSHPLEGILLHPVAVLSLILIAINSARWHFSDTIEWAGRIYSKRSDR